MNYLDFSDKIVYFNSGINENVFFKGLEHEMTEEYEAIVLNFENKEGKTFSDKMYLPSTGKVYTFGDESEMDALAREEKNFNTKLRSIFLNWATEVEILQHLQKENPTNTVELIAAYNKLLPANYDSIPGRLVLLYKSNGYLEVPKRVTATRCNMLFSTNDNDNMNLNSWAAKKLTFDLETKSKQETDW